MKLYYSKPSYNTLNYASTTNIKEVTKFYNLGNNSFETDFSTLKPCLQTVVTIAKHVCDYVPKGILNLSKYRLQIFPVKGHYVESLQLYGNQSHAWTT